MVDRSPEGLEGGFQLRGAQLRNIRAEAEAKGLILQYKLKQFVETVGERIVQRVGSDRAILYNLLISHISRICLVFQLFTQKLKVCLLRLR